MTAFGTVGAGRSVTTRRDAGYRHGCVSGCRGALTLRRDKRAGSDADRRRRFRGGRGCRRLVRAPGRSQPVETDRAEARDDRSGQAALSIAESIASTEEALVAWSAGQSSLVELRAAFNAFSRAAEVQSTALTDRVLRNRVRRHIELLARVAGFAQSTPAGATALIPTARLHAGAVIEALDAQYNNAALPPYQPLPMDDAAGLIGWQLNPAQSRGQAAGADTNGGR